jgi:hypothetical protein
MDRFATGTYRQAFSREENRSVPLRDHFHPPLSKRASWEGFQGQWPAMIVQQLVRVLPEGYVAEPRVHLGLYFEIDVEVEADWPNQYEYEVLVFDQERDRRLVAAVELVSPANKDRPESRRAFVTKAAALLQKDVAIAIVDLVTIRQFNLYAELLEWIGQHDPGLGADPSPIYAVALRFQKPSGRSRLQTWPYPLVLEKPLPTLPLWLSADLAVPLELEASYEDTCRVLRIA